MSIKFNPFTGTLDYLGNVSATGINSLNGQTGNSQSFDIDEAGTDFQVNSLSDVHTFSLPKASGSTSGKLSQNDWTMFNDHQQYKVEVRTLSLIDIANKYIILETAPRDKTRVSCSPVGGAEQNNGLDFLVTTANSNRRFTWDSLILDGELASGDILVIKYF